MLRRAGETPALRRRVRPLAGPMASSGETLRLNPPCGSIRKRLPQVVPVQSIYLQQAVKGDPLALFDCEKVRCRFKLDVRAASPLTWDDLALQVERIGIALEMVGEP